MRECLDFVRDFIAEKGYSPSFTEIGGAIGLKSKGGVHSLIRQLKERGMVEYLPHRARSVRLTDAVPKGVVA